jgi:hypothetical protein
MSWRGLGTGRCEAAGAGRGGDPAGRAPLSSGYRGRPPRSQLVRAERGNPVWVRPLGRWADREESRSLGGKRMTEKRMPAAERRQETGT